MSRPFGTNRKRFLRGHDNNNLARVYAYQWPVWRERTPPSDDTKFKYCMNFVTLHNQFEGWIHFTLLLYSLASKYSSWFCWSDLTCWVEVWWNMEIDGWPCRPCCCHTSLGWVIPRLSLASQTTCQIHTHCDGHQPVELSVTQLTALQPSDFDTHQVSLAWHIWWYRKSSGIRTHRPPPPAPPHTHTHDKDTPEQIDR